VKASGPSPSGREPRPAEFDSYASGYDAGMANPLKRMLGASAEQYMAVKVRWLRGDLASFASHPMILDFGCGEGALLRQWAGLGEPASLHGCDVSQGMLEEARRRWPLGRPLPELRPSAGSRAPFEDDSMDVVVACAVFHHVPPPDRPAGFAELMRVLRPGGRVYVFEHNPLNPLTVHVVNRTPIDRNAVLLHAREVLDGLRAAGTTNARVRYLHFTPPRWRYLGWLDPLLARFPLGAGYVVRGEKPTQADGRPFQGSGVR
jgi:SAM-dependent methyltransferase